MVRVQLAGDGDAAPARRDQDRAVPRLQELLDQVRLHDLEGSRGGHNAAPATPRILHHLPPLRPPHDKLLVALVRRADRLRRLLERGVRGVHDDLGDEARDGPRGPARGELVLEGLLEQVPDLRLRLRDEDVEGHRGHPRPGLLVLDQDRADLRAVAVRHDDLEPRLDEVREPRGGPRDVGLHRPEAGVLRRGDRVPADRDDGKGHGLTEGSGSIPAHPM